MGKAFYGIVGTKAVAAAAKDQQLTLVNDSGFPLTVSRLRLSVTRSAAAAGATANSPLPAKASSAVASNTDDFTSTISVNVRIGRSQLFNTKVTVLAIQGTDGDAWFYFDAMPQVPANAEVTVFIDSVCSVAVNVEAVAAGMIDDGK